MWDLRKRRHLQEIDLGAEHQYPDRGWAKSREMLEVARRSSDPFILTTAFCHAVLHYLVRGATAPQKPPEEASARAEEIRLPSLSAQAFPRTGAPPLARAPLER